LSLVRARETEIKSVKVNSTSEEKVDLTFALHKNDYQALAAASTTKKEK
jgi:hypothetical protein